MAICIVVELFEGENFEEDFEEKIVDTIETIEEYGGLLKDFLSDEEILIALTGLSRLIKHNRSK